MSNSKVKNENSKSSFWEKLKNFFGVEGKQRDKEILFNYQGALTIEKEKRNGSKDIDKEKTFDNSAEVTRDNIKNKRSDQQSRLYGSEMKKDNEVDEKIKEVKKVKKVKKKSKDIKEDENKNEKDTKKDEILNESKEFQDVSGKVSFLEKFQTKLNKLLKKDSLEDEKEQGDEVGDSVNNNGDMFLPKSKWKAPHVLKTNLIRDEVTTFFEWRKNLIKLSVYLIVSSMIVGGLYLALLQYEKESSKYGDDIVREIEKIEKTIASLEEKKNNADQLRGDVEIVQELLEKHIYWSEFFKFLEDNLLPNVYLTDGISGEADGNYSFSAVTDNFSTITDQIRVLNANENVKSVSVLSANLSERKDKIDDIKGEKEENIEEITIDEINFTMELVVDNSLFFK